MKTVLIITGGDYSPIPDNLKYDYVIACDAGYNNAIKLGIKPDLVMGDFDSYEGNPECDIQDIPIKRFKVMKDDTDTMLAIKQAIVQGCTNIILACALGGRMDHLFANIQSMAYVASRGLECSLYSANEYMTTLTEGETVIPRDDKCAFSVFALTDKVTGLSIEGSAYDVKNAELENTFPLGACNKWNSDQIKVSIQSGILLIVKSNLNE